MGRGPQQQEGADDPPDAADRGQRHQNRLLHFQVMAKCPAAESQSGPQGNRVGGVGWDGRNSGEQQGGKGDEASTAGNSIESAAESGGHKQDRDVVWMEGADVQASNVSEWGGRSSPARVNWAFTVRQKLPYGVDRTRVANK